MRRRWRLVDRDHEFGLLAELVKRSLAGSGEFAVVEGPPGIGKTRLLEEVLSSAGGSRVGVLAARCSLLERDATFGTVRRLVEPVIAGAGAEQRRRLFDGAAAAVARLCDDGVEGADQSSEFGNFHGLYWLISNLCQEAPQILVVDDLQWCDAPSLRFLSYLIHRSADLPLSVLLAARSTDPGPESHLLDHLAAAPDCLTLRLGPLSESSALHLLTTEFRGTAEPAFLKACYLATAGNPLLLSELIDLVAESDMRPTADNTNAVMALSYQSVARWVNNRLAPLPVSLREVAQAAALLGHGVDIHTVGAVAEVPIDSALAAADQLSNADLVRFTGAPHLTSIEFVHPLVRDAIYNGMDRHTRSRMHARAAGVLAAAGRDVEDVAAHVLLTQHVTSPPALAVVRAAARQASSRGAPEGAVVYLRRALDERLSDVERVEVLFDLGASAQLVDLSAAAGYLSQALELDHAGTHSVAVAGMLGGVLLQMGEPTKAVQTLTNAVAAVDPNETDLKDRFGALLLNVPILEPGWGHLVPKHSREPISDGSAGVGRRMMDAVYSLHETFACNPLGPVRADSALKDDVLIREISGEGALVCAWLSMLAADMHSVMTSLDAAVADAHRHGSTRGLAPAYAVRGLAWFFQGQLCEAEADLREARATVDAGNITIGRLFTGPFLAQVLAAQGRVPEAREVLHWVTGGTGMPTSGPCYFYMLADATLLRLGGDAQSALQAATRCGERYAAHGGENPALIPWRSEAALCLSDLGLVDQALTLVDEELVLAQKWGTPRALGRALRIKGSLIEGPVGLELLQESTKVLTGVRVDLERAESLIATGARLSRLQRLDEARNCLLEGLEQAEICGATGLIAAGRRELAAIGARPRRLARSGMRSLTPSERRIVELAADGHTNRQIAQELFVTSKTVEIHLTAAYRKLGVKGRDQLPTILEL